MRSLFDMGRLISNLGTCRIGCEVGLDLYERAERASNDHNFLAIHIVVSWAKGPRQRPNRIQSGESRGAVEYINVSSVFSSGQFCGKSLHDPGHGVSGHVFDGTRKDKETLRVELVETQARTNAKGVQYELRSESVRVKMPKTSVVELLAL